MSQPHSRVSSLIGLPLLREGGSSITCGSHNDQIAKTSAPIIIYIPGLVPAGSDYSNHRSDLLDSHLVLTPVGPSESRITQGNGSLSSAFDYLEA